VSRWKRRQKWATHGALWLTITKTPLVAEELGTKNHSVVAAKLLRTPGYFIDCPDQVPR
jgi:hypothetical protein